MSTKRYAMRLTVAFTLSSARLNYAVYRCFDLYAFAPSFGTQRGTSNQNKLSEIRAVYSGGTGVYIRDIAIERRCNSSAKAERTACLAIWYACLFFVECAAYHKLYFPRTAAIVCANCIPSLRKMGFPYEIFVKYTYIIWMRTYVRAVINIKWIVSWVRKTRKAGTPHNDALHTMGITIMTATNVLTCATYSQLDIVHFIHRICIYRYMVLAFWGAELTRTYSERRVFVDFPSCINAFVGAVFA